MLSPFCEDHGECYDRKYGLANADRDACIRLNELLIKFNTLNFR